VATICYCSNKVVRFSRTVDGQCRHFRRFKRVRTVCRHDGNSSFTSCSQNRITEYPEARSRFDTNRSRFLFVRNFARQYLVLVLGNRPQIGHPCQKQPSTKTTSLSARKKKSGFPRTSGGRIAHPLIPARTSPALNLASVVLFPPLLLARMIFDRASGTSAKRPPGR